jgi:hypothetical protein
MITFQQQQEQKNTEAILENKILIHFFAFE